MNNNLNVNVVLINTMHNEFLLLLSDIKNCDSDKFMTLFDNIIEYAKDHFKVEEEIMNIHEFYDTQEYIKGHNRTLYEMQYFYEKAKEVPEFGKSYINDYAYDKFKRHIVSIDFQLKVFLK
ncbi:MAG: hemerythrin [Sulfurimonas sp.]|jgi:hemerythrin|uniref:hemerythrin family protein n=1 Tax=Sulfurimonas sp. TaxID=2022749 RepID=UPI0039E45543